VLHHTWTDEGVIAAPAANGAQVLHLSVALCVLNDTYREAERLGIEVDGVAVEAPAHSGRLQIWVLERPGPDGQD
jgi:hypothetical protein